MKKTVLYITILFISSMLFSYQSEDLLQTKTGSSVSVYRFFNTIRGGHLYTVSIIEKDYILDSLPEWQYEGISFKVYLIQASDTTPAYRFFNTITGIHLYTISEHERDYIIDNLSEWNYEGVSFYVYPYQTEETIPVFRFFNNNRGGHLYTISEIERDHIIDHLIDWTYEGISFYVYPKIDSRSVPKTGQTVSYRSGDDGYYQMGIAWPEPRFTDNDDGTVTDNLTGLMWTKSANLNGKLNWSDTIDYCHNLNLAGYTDWRLPNIRELFSLIDIEEYDPALPNCHLFANPENDRYWSSSTLSGNPELSWSVNTAWGYVQWDLKSANHYIIAVRGDSHGNPVPKTGQTASYRNGDDGYHQMGVSWPEPRFTDNNNGTITDNLTGLIWLKNPDSSNVNWNNAIDYCNTLDYAGYTDWRLPNIREIFSLIDIKNADPALPDGHPFTDIHSAGYIWSSSTYIRSIPFAWRIGLHHGAMNSQSKSNIYSIWPVRAGE